MPLTDDLVLRTLVALDPFRWTWSDRASAPRGVSALRHRLERLRERAQAGHAGRGMGDVAHLLRLVDPARAFGAFPDVPPLAGRHAVVLAHGPSLRALLPSIAAQRDRLYVVAPLRTALQLADAGVWADVVVLADAAAETSALSLAAWQAAPVAHRRTLQAQATLVTEPLAPAGVHGGFAQVRAFDDGLGWMPADAALPFWGSAMLPSVCLPLALGAPTVAIGGMDMGATHGRAGRTWSGRATRLDPKLTIALGLLEALGTALPGRFVDLSADAIVKRGFQAVDVPGLLARPVAEGDRVVHPRYVVRAADALRSLVGEADRFGEIVAGMAATASRVCALVAADDRSPELASLVDEMEHAWAHEPGCRSALRLLQPPYLRALWQLREAGLTSRDPRASASMKARLIGPEIAGLEGAYRQWLTVIRDAAGAAGRTRTIA